MRVLDKFVETMLDGCAGSNHVTEELVCGMLNRAVALGIMPQDKRFPRSMSMGSSGASVPLKGLVLGADHKELQTGDSGRAVDCEAKG